MTQAPLRLLIHGASGRMGQALRRLLAADPRFALAAAFAAQARPAEGIGDAARLEQAPEFDLAVDFSLPQGFDAVLALCVERGRPLVSGTTGLSAAQQQALVAAGSRIPVLWAANFSLGVAVLTELVRRASAALQGWDRDIVEIHHVHKKDAPSGTALALGAAMAGLGAAPRYASLRAGDVIGEHSVLFTGLGERLELIHRASDRDVFARGALEAAALLSGRPPGTYRLADLLPGLAASLPS